MHKQSCAFGSLGSDLVPLNHSEIGTILCCNQKSYSSGSSGSSIFILISECI